MADNEGQKNATKPTLTAADRIADLNSIDASISTLLSSASEAVGILANAPGSSNGTGRPTSLPSAQAAFTEAASTYFSTLSSIEVRLRRQVYALEEAGLIQPGDERDAKRGRTIGGENVGRGGGGSLDTSWLNARASDKVGEGMDAELWKTARQFVGEIQAREKEARKDSDPPAEDGDMDLSSG